MSAGVSDVEPAKRDENRPAFLTRGRIPGLDGLRALAVALVFFAHACQTQGFPVHGRITWYGERCAIGVEVFFVISGFLISTLMLREQDRNGQIDIRAFYTRRAFRILPAYFAFLSVLLCLSLLHSLAPQRRDWIGAVSYTVNFLRHPTWEFGHIWSLSIEEHFYLLWPLVMLLGIRFARGAGVALITGCFLLRWGVLLALPRYTQMAELWTFTRLDTISFGCLLALVAWDEHSRERLDRMCSPRWLGPILVVMLIASNFVFPRVSSGMYGVGIAYTVNALLITLLLWLTIRSRNAWYRSVIDHPALVAVGVGSYSLYLWQQLFLNPHRDGFLQRFPQNIAFAALAATASFRCVERPFLRLKDRMGRKEHGPVSAPTSDTGTPRELAESGAL